MKSFEHDQLMYERGIEQGRLAEIKNTERERQNTEKEKLRADMAQSRIKELEAELRKYKELLDTGIITQDEFEKKKSQILNL